MTTPRFQSFKDFQAHLDALGMFHMDLALGRMERALARLGLDAPFCASVQVVGTNAKGSTSTLLAAVLTAQGVRTGLYTSPHFVSPRERVLVDAAPLPDRLWLEAAEAVLAASADVSPGDRLTYFELLTVMAAWMFRAAGCAAVVYEAGLGGAHDATTALRHHLNVFTPISLDHTGVLGDSLELIARDKAGAMRPGVPAVTADQPPAAMAELAARTAAVGAPLALAGDVARAHGAHWPDAPAMGGPHQRDNLRLALAARHVLGTAAGLPAPDDAAMTLGARRAFIPGRFQRVPGAPELILDGAHNPDGMACLARALADAGLAPGAAVFSCMRDKDLEGMLPPLLAAGDFPVFVPALPGVERAFDPAALAARIGPRAVAVPDLGQALEQARDAARARGGPLLVCGSLYLLGEVYARDPRLLASRAESGPAHPGPDEIPG